MWNPLILGFIFILFSILGYFLEYINECRLGYCKEHTSYLTKPLPFLPIYGLGAVLLWNLTPYLVKYNIAVQFLLLLLLLTAFEYLSGKMRKVLTGEHSWQYSNGNVVDIQHSLIWALFGLVLIHIFAPIQAYLKA